MKQFNPVLRTTVLFNSHVLACAWLVLVISNGYLPSQVMAQEGALCVEITRRIPPPGREVPEAVQQVWQAAIVQLRQQLDRLNSPYEADVAMLLKACEYAIEHQEFYRENDSSKVDRLIELARQRLSEIGDGQPSWLATSGRQVRGFRSDVDGSVQPVGLVFSDGISRQAGTVPLYVWLHGRGDKVTDLHFICERLDKDGKVKPEGAIILHPFGRHCVGYKSAGETDVLEAIRFACENYPVDQQRIVLMGFSMGGAGVWHLAAHYGERFVAASPGAGFAETARYRGLTPDQFPPKYEQMLWSIYDVPGYTRNLFNLPIVAYSGEVDKQIQAARVMEEAFRSEGRELPHLIGPGMGHAYHPDTLAEILGRMAEAAETGKPGKPNEVFIQTQHPRYGSRDWITIDGANKQYSDARVDAIRNSSGWKLVTKNVTRLILDCSQRIAKADKLEVDGQQVPFTAGQTNRITRGLVGDWQLVDRFPVLRKRPGISGPIDDAFIDPFLMVLPSRDVADSPVNAWVKCELEHFRSRWKAIFRGEPRTKLDINVTEQDIREFHLVLWGTPQSNTLIDQFMSTVDRTQLPLQWTSEQLTFANEEFDGQDHIPLLIYPNPSNPDKYVVMNSGPTFREAHDRTNSLQNPHLPDWVILSVSETPSDERPGRVIHTGFFDDAWGVDADLRW